MLQIRTTLDARANVSMEFIRCCVLVAETSTLQYLKTFFEAIKHNGLAKIFING